MNKHAVAIAADSAVTMGDTHKVINSANKIFTLSKFHPVAVISKGDGFIWIKRKHYFSPELNTAFFSNYFK